MKKSVEYQGRRRFLAMSTGMVGALALGGPARASVPAGFPTRTIRMVVPFTPGGSTDILGRSVAQALSERINQSVVVENRAGGGGIIGAQAVARANPDGYTLLFTPGTIFQTPVLNPSVQMVPQDELVPLSMATEGQLIVVTRPELPINTMAEFIEYAKRKDGDFPVGYPGLGTTNHITLEFLMSQLGFKTNSIPYGGNADVATAILGGEIVAAVDSAGAMRQYVESGRVRAIAVTGMEPSPILPGVPTINETVLPGFSMTTWTGVFAPVGTPADAVDYLSRELDAAVHDPALVERLRTLGFESIGKGPQMLRARVAADIKRANEFVQQTGFSIK